MKNELCILFLLSGIPVLLILLYLLSYMADKGLRNCRLLVYKQWNRFDKIDSMSNLLIMGNSRASCHIDPEILDTYLPFHSYNLGLNDGGMDAVLHAWHLYRMHIKKVPCVILLSMDWTTLDISNIPSIRITEYLPWCSDPAWRTIISKTGFTFADKVVPLWKYRHHRHFLSKGLKEYTGIQRSGYGRDIMSYERGYICLDDKVPMREVKPLDEIVLDFSSLDLFFQMCRQENIIVICFYSPVYSSYRSQWEISTRTLISDHIRHFDIPFLDYSEREENSDSSYFKDNIHLNRKGAAWFTRLLAQDVASVLKIA